MPSSWKTYGVDGNQDGVRDPYNPVDSIFAAARYLRAAGADRDLRRAVFAYNHADWYVDSVLTRARMIGGLPAGLVGSLTGLTQGRFPVNAKARYAGAVSTRSERVGSVARTRPVPSSRAPAAAASASTRATAPPWWRPTTAASSAPGSASASAASSRSRTSTATPTPTGTSPRSSGPIPRPSHGTSAGARSARSSSCPRRTRPRSSPRRPPSARRPGARRAGRPRGGDRQGAGPSSSRDAAAGATKERLFANPRRPRSRRAGGDQQLYRRMGSGGSDAYLRRLFGDTRGIEWKRLKRGARVVAGTTLGRLGATVASQTPHLVFEVRPAGAPRPAHRPQADPRRLEAARVDRRLRRLGAQPLLGPRRADAFDRPDPADEQGDAGAAGAGQPAHPALRVRPPRRGGRPGRPARAGHARVPRRLWHAAQRQLPQVRPQPPHHLGQRLRALVGQRGRHRGDQRRPDPGPPGRRLDHGARHPAPADPAGHAQAPPDHQPDDLRGDRQHVRDGRPRRPHPRGLEAVVRGQLPQPRARSTRSSARGSGPGSSTAWARSRTRRSAAARRRTRSSPAADGPARGRTDERPARQPPLRLRAVGVGRTGSARRRALRGPALRGRRGPPRRGDLGRDGPAAPAARAAPHPRRGPRPRPAPGGRDPRDGGGRRAAGRGAGRGGLARAGGRRGRPGDRPRRPRGAQPGRAGPPRGHRRPLRRRGRAGPRAGHARRLRQRGQTGEGRWEVARELPRPGRRPGDIAASRPRTASPPCWPDATSRWPARSWPCAPASTSTTAASARPPCRPGSPSTRRSPSSRAGATSPASPRTSRSCSGTAPPSRPRRGPRCRAGSSRRRPPRSSPPSAAWRRRSATAPPPPVTPSLSTAGVLAQRRGWVRDAAPRARTPGVSKWSPPGRPTPTRGRSGTPSARVRATR